MLKRPKPKLLRKPINYSVALKADKKRESILAKYSKSVNPSKKDIFRRHNSNVSSFGNALVILPQQQPILHRKTFSTTQTLEKAKNLPPKIHGLEGLDFSPISKIDQTPFQAPELEGFLLKPSETISLLKKESEGKNKEIQRLRDELRERDKIIRSLKIKIKRK